MNGYCECGCGERTSLVTHADHRRGAVRGGFRRFVHGHNNKGEAKRKQRFLEKVAKRPDGCWEWLGTKTKGGYPRMSFDTAYRWAYQHYIGPIPEGDELHHLCGNRSCVNPDHLQPMSKREHLRLHREAIP